MGRAKSDAVKTIADFTKANPNGKLIIVGHSMGADIGVEIAKENPSINIDLLITIDIKSIFEDDNIPSNVNLVLNYHQSNGILRGSEVEIDDPEKTRSANIEVKDDGVTHTNIDNKVSDKVVTSVKSEAKLKE